MPKAKKGKWEDVNNTYIEEIDGYFSQAKCSICKQYSAQYSKYGLRFWLEYCSHCGSEMLSDTDAGEIANCIEFRKRMKR